MQSNSLPDADLNLPEMKTKSPTCPAGGVHMYAAASWILIWLEIDILLFFQQLWGWNTLALWRDMREILFIRKDVQKRETQQLNLNLYHCKPRS